MDLRPLAQDGSQLPFLTVVKRALEPAVVGALRGSGSVAVPCRRSVEVTVGDVDPLESQGVDA